MTQFVHRFLQWIVKYWPIWILGLVTMSIALTNLPPKGWLTGWDNLHSEFWSSMNVGRSWSAVWQEYQGLGLLGGMGHAADFFRELAMWVAGLIVPTEWLRYGYHILMYFVGMVGVYTLLQQTLSKRYSECVGKVSALLGAIYYGLNLGSILYFYAPFEPYSTFWGMLPWEMYILIKYLQKPSKSNLLWFFAINLLSVAQGYVQTLFLIYGICFGIIVLANIIKNRSVTSIKRGLVAGVVLLAVNAFWVLPAGYYVTSAVDDHNNSAQVSFSTDMFYLMNKGRGTIKDFVQMKLFYYDFTDWKGDGNGFDYFSPAWVQHYQYEWVSPILYGFMVLIVLGLFIEFPYRGAFIGVFLVGLIAFLSKEPGFSQVNDLMRKNELFAQLFRNPYTKLIVPTVMTMSIFLGVGTAKLIELGNKYVGRYVAVIFISALIMVGLVGISKPVWSGEFFYKAEKIDIPSEYLKLFDFMKSSADPNGRIALLPAHYLWGWANHNWGYRGSGFLWYGIKQPILDRAFDVWSSNNETFYYEFSTAIYGSGEVEKVLKKYDVRYVLLDKSISDIGLNSETFKYQQTEKLLDELKYKRVFKEGLIIVWDTGSRGDQFVRAPDSYNLVEGDVNKVRRDVVLEQGGTYVQSQSSDHSPKILQGSELGYQGTTIYPFIQLMREEVKGVEYGEGKVTVSYEETPHTLKSSQLIISGWKVGEIVRVEYKDGKAIPAYRVNGQDGPKFLGKEKPKEGENFIVARVSTNSEWVEYLHDQKFTIQGSELKIEVDGAPIVYDFATEGNKDVTNCDVLKRGTVSKDGNSYYADDRGSICDYIVMGELDTRLSYLMRIQGQDIVGRSTKFFLFNTGSERNDIEYLLGKDKFDQTFGLLPWSSDGYYTLNIETRSFGQRAENVVGPVEVRYFPLEQIAGARVISQSTDATASSDRLLVQPFSDSVALADGLQFTNNLKIMEVRKTGTWLYRVKVEGSGLLRLSQGYDEGWIAPPIEHVRVDGWANGWIINQSGEVTICYWPQLLEYVGFGLLGLTFWLVVKMK